MNDCMNAEVRDALPDLLHDRLSDLDRATMKAHVESCADCRAELALMERVRAYAPLVPTIDVARIVSMLPSPRPSADQQIASIAPARQRSSMSMAWKIAAAAALLAAGTLTFSNARKPASPIGAVAVIASAAPVTAPVEVPAITPSTAPTQVAVATPAVSARVKTIKATGSAGLSLTGGVQDLTDAQLEALLKDVDNVDGLPTVEPEAISVSVDGNEGLQ